MTRFSLLVFIAAQSCSCCLGLLPNKSRTFYADPRYETTGLTNFDVNPNRMTESGIAVDSRGLDNFGDEQLKLVDSLTADLEKCLMWPIFRWGFTVKVVSEFTDISGQEVFPCPGTETGLCYGICQWPAVAVVTPNLYALKHELIHIVTHQDHGAPVFRCQ